VKAMDGRERCAIREGRYNSSILLLAVFPPPLAVKRKSDVSIATTVWYDPSTLLLVCIPAFLDGYRRERCAGR